MVGRQPGTRRVGGPGAFAVDLLVLDDAPLWLTGRVAQHGRLLFDDDPPARVAWQADTRLQYLDDLPAHRARQQAWKRLLAARAARG